MKNYFYFLFSRRHELKTFVTAVIVTIAVLDIVDVVRILPVLSETVFQQDIFRHVYYSLGVFHELAIAIFLVSISVAVCVQVGESLCNLGVKGGPCPRKFDSLLLE